MPAIAAVGAVDIIIIGLAAMLVAVALIQLFRPVIQSGLSAVPLIGGWLATNADLVLLRAVAGSVTFVSTATAPLADLLRRSYWAIVLPTITAVEALESVYSALWRVRYQVLPAVAAQLTAYTVGLFAQAETYAQALYRAALAYVETRIAQTIAYTVQLFAQAVAYAQGLDQLERAFALTLYQQSLAYTLELARQGELLTLHTGQIAEAYAADLMRQVLKYVGAADQALAIQIERVLIDAEGYARALERVAVDHADQVAGATAAAAAAATGAVAARVTDIERSPCQQFCSPLGEIGQLLQALGDAGLAAALLAMAAEMARDPEGAARAIDGAAGGLVGDLVQGISGEADAALGQLGVFTRVGGPAWAGR